MPFCWMSILFVLEKTCFSTVLRHFSYDAPQSSPKWSSYGLYSLPFKARPSHWFCTNLMRISLASFSWCVNKQTAKQFNFYGIYLESNKQPWGIWEAVTETGRRPVQDYWSGWNLSVFLFPQWSWESFVTLLSVCFLVFKWGLPAPTSKAYFEN